MLEEITEENGNNEGADSKQNQENPFNLDQQDEPGNAASTEESKSEEIVVEEDEVAEEAPVEPSSVVKEKPAVQAKVVNDHGLDWKTDIPTAPTGVAKNLEELRNSYGKLGTICIRPYVNANIENMGLEKLGMVVFPNTYQMEDMAAIEFRGKVKYINGLDEFAASVQQIPDLEKKAAKILMIRTVVAQLEREKAFNHVDIDDVNFWSKAETFRPDNKDVWGEMSRKCDNRVIYLDPIRNIDDLLTVIAIENGGFPGIAKSFEDARASRRNPKWFLDKQSDTVDVRTSSSRLKNRALGLLEELTDNDPRKLLFVCKLVDNNSLLYNYGTRPNQIYDTMDAFIGGEGAEGNIKTASQLFLDYSARNIGELKLRCVIKDGSFLNHIVTKGSDQFIHLASDNTKLGRNIAEVYEFLTNPVNDDVRYKLTNLIESHWKK